SPGGRERDAKAHSRTKGIGHHSSESCGRKKVVEVPQKKEAVELMKNTTGMSERRACRLIGFHRSTKRYVSLAPDNTELKDAICKLANERRRFGYRRIHAQ